MSVLGSGGYGVDNGDTDWEGREKADGLMVLVEEAEEAEELSSVTGEWGSSSRASVGSSGSSGRIERSGGWLRGMGGSAGRFRSFARRNSFRRSVIARLG